MQLNTSRGFKHSEFEFQLSMLWNAFEILGMKGLSPESLSLQWLGSDTHPQYCDASCKAGLQQMQLELSKNSKASDSAGGCGKKGNILRAVFLSWEVVAVIIVCVQTFTKGTRVDNNHTAEGWICLEQLASLLVQKVRGSFVTPHSCTVAQQSSLLHCSTVLHSSNHSCTVASTSLAQHFHAHYTL